MRRIFLPLLFAACGGPSDLAEVESPALSDGAGDTPTRDGSGSTYTNTGGIDGSAANVPGITPFSLRRVWYVDRSSFTVVEVQKVSGQWKLPHRYYDVHPTLVHFVFEPVTELSTATVLSSGYLRRVRLEGSLLTPGVDGTAGDYYFSSGTFMCAAGKTCLWITIQGDRLFQDSPTWDVKFEYAKKPYVGQTADWKAITNYIQATLDKSYFADKLFPTFYHERCTTCHSLGDKATLVARHGNLLTADQITVTATPNGSQLRCGSGCHLAVANAVPSETFEETEWMTPGFDQGINFSGLTAQQICNKVVSRLPTATDQQTHFFEDARIAWAVHSGVLPLGHGTLPTAPPNDFYDFKNVFNWWIDSGAPCP